MAEYIRRGKVGEPKVVSELPGSWTKRHRETFLNHLAATCNVAESCRAAGRCKTGAYALRRSDPAFAEQWRAALLAGYDTLEARLLEHAMGALNLVEHGEVETAPFDPEVAIRILGMHHAKLKGSARGAPPRGGPRVKRATEEETNAAIMKQLAVLDRRLAAEERRKAEAEAKARAAGAGKP